jgi:hypothetical protein
MEATISNFERTGWIAITDTIVEPEYSLTSFQTLFEVQPEQYIRVPERHPRASKRTTKIIDFFSR